MEKLTTFETAKLAKEKGFKDEPMIPSVWLPTIGKSLFVWNIKTEVYSYYRDTPNEDLIFTTTQSLLQKWLRGEHKIDTGLYYWDNDSYSYKLSKIVDKKMKHLTKDVFVGSYEETLEAALEEALNQI